MDEKAKEKRNKNKTSTPWSDGQMQYSVIDFLIVKEWLVCYLPHHLIFLQCVASVLI